MASTLLRRPLIRHVNQSKINPGAQDHERTHRRVFEQGGLSRRGFVRPEEHVLVGPDGRLAGVIDPSGPWIADPALDFGTLAERFGWAFADTVLASYAGPLDPGFTRRACFCANVRPLVTIEAGLRHQSEERLRLGLRRLAERMADATSRCPIQSPF